MAGRNVDVQGPREVVATNIYFLFTESVAHPGGSKHCQGILLSKMLLTCFSYSRGQDLDWLPGCPLYYSKYSPQEIHLFILTEQEKD